MPSKKVSTAKNTGPARVKTPRRLKRPKYAHFRFSKRIKHPAPKLPSAWRLFRDAFDLLAKNWKIFGALILIYGLISFVVVSGMSAGSGVQNAKNSLDTAQTATGISDKFSNSLALYGVLLGASTGSSDQLTSAYQSVIILLASLTFIWVLRHVYDKKSKNVSIKQAIYRSPYPLIPFILIVMLIGVQLFPMLIGNSIYSFVVGNGLAASVGEQLVWAAVFFWLTVLSFYWVAVSSVSLYIVTLPDMTPLKALRSAKELIRFRRWTVMRKVAFLVPALLVLGAVIIMPVIIFLTPIAEFVFLIVSIFGLALAHSYMYNLYRKLL